MNLLKHNLRYAAFLFAFLVSGLTTFAQKETPTQKNTPSTVIKNQVDLQVVRPNSDNASQDNNGSGGQSTGTTVITQAPGFSLQMDAGSVYTNVLYTSAGNDGNMSNVTNNNIVDCPMMFVDVTVPFLQSCIASTAQIDYCNQGSAAAINSYVDVEFPIELTLDSASLPYTIVGTNIYRFQLGTVLTNSCDIFDVHFTTACDSSLIGNSHCIKAHIYPDTLCNGAHNDYLLSVNGKCAAPGTKFTVQNHGMPLTLDQKVQIIIIDDHLLGGSGNPTVIKQDTIAIGKDSTLGFNISGIYSDVKLKVIDNNNTVLAYSSIRGCTAAPSNPVIINHHTEKFAENNSHLPFVDEACSVNGQSSNSQTNTMPNATPESINKMNTTQKSSRFDLLNKETTTIQVYPNPFTQYATVQIEGPIADHFTFRLYDVTGQMVQSRIISKQREFRIERNNLLNGMYLYQIESDGTMIGAGKIMLK